MPAFLHGIDLVEVNRITRVMSDQRERFLKRCFTDAERDYALANKKRRDEHLAVRFAAKEAVLKALGTGVRDGIRWTDVEVHRGPTGAPSVQLEGKALEIAERLGVSSWQISLTHAGGFAMASAIAILDDA